jgi:hypothetical protein
VQNVCRAPAVSIISTGKSLGQFASGDARWASSAETDDSRNAIAGIDIDP